MDTNKQGAVLQGHYLVSVTTYYTRQEKLRERTFNLIFTSNQANITKADLAAIQQQGMQRINAENGVEPEDVQDMVINNIVMLGVMSEADFTGTEPTVDQATDPIN